MKNLLLITYLVPLFLSISVTSQEQQSDQLAALLEKLESGGASSGISVEKPGDSGYKSFVQNELQNIFAQIDALTEQEKEDITFNEVNQKRIELATSLCTKDLRACFLIDEYRAYTSQKDIPTRIEELQLFGQDIFSGYSNDFNFYDSLPLKDSYIVKIGDLLKISVYGGFQFEEDLTIDMTGSIVIPEIGAIQIAGLSFKEASLKLEQSIAQAYAGSKALLSLTQIRSKQIFILGNVKTPGTYALNAFGTALNGLISSGGVSNNSSLRSIQVIRGDQTIHTIDLYNLLIHGNVKSSDFILNDGDSVLVGGLKSSASIIGEVIRPAIYEIKQNETLYDLINFALGTTAFADQSNISVERLLISGETTILKPKDPSKFNIVNGDKITVNSASGQKINSIDLIGAIRNAGEYSLQDSKTLGDIVNVQTDLLENTYTGFAVIKRLNFSSKSYRLINFSLSNQAELDQINLYSGDKVFIFSRDDIQYSQSQEVYSYLINIKDNSLNNGLSNILSNQGLSQLENVSQPKNLSNLNSCLSALDVLKQNPISNLMEAKLKIFPAGEPRSCTPIFQENSDLLPIILINSIPVAGNVRFPGLYPTARDLNGLDLFNIAGGFLISKLNISPEFDIGIRGRGFGSFVYDEISNVTNITMLNLKLDQGSTPGGYVKLVGEFQNPGVYPIAKGLKISEIYSRSGGLTSQAYPLGGVLTRESIRVTESEALERAKSELSEILASAVASGYLKQNSTDLVGLISLMTNMSNVKPVGRLVTELNPTQINANPSLDIPLKDGDIIYIPPMLNTVTIVGQVLNPVTVPHEPGTSFDDYIEFAGGLKKEADKRKIYAVLPNGISTRRAQGLKLPVLPFMPFHKSDILPGSTIIVPRQARPLDSLALVETLTPILANLSVTAAAIAAISDNSN